MPQGKGTYVSVRGRPNKEKRKKAKEKRKKAKEKKKSSMAHTKSYRKG